MMKGPASGPRARRKANEPRTIGAIHTQAGTRRNLSTKVDLGQSPRQLRRLGRAGLDPDVGCRRRDVAEHGVRDRLPADGLLERGGVQVGRAAEVVLAPHESSAASDMA